MLKEKEITYRDIGNILGISETSVSHKINGYSDFFISEVEKIKNKYGIPENFFAHKVSITKQNDLFQIKKRKE